MDHPSRLSPRKSRAPPLKIKRRATPADDVQVLFQDKKILLALLCIRIFNALTIRTFFQPDEYYQALEPAWKFVYGYGETTWEWKEGIRGFLYISQFASTWWVFNMMGIRDATALIAMPKVRQAIAAALCDYWTYRLAKRLFNQNVAKWTLFCTITSVWNWFTLTRTFSNSLETTLTAGALLYWPWPSLSNLPTIYSSRYITFYSPDRRYLSTSLILASLAVILRPTSIITFLLLLPWSFSPTLLLYAIIIGPTTLLSSIVLDTWFYGRPTFPAWNFIRFNFVEELSVFYGSMSSHYYFSQGLPMILTTYLPFSIHGLLSYPISIYTFVIGGVVLAFSCIDHKEARFLSPLSPLLLVFAGYSISRLPKRIKRFVIPAILLVNTGLAYYTTQVHQSGVISVMHHLRNDIPKNGSVGFLMPCYSTPWQSYLQRPDVNAWKLSCDPPLTYVSRLLGLRRLSREERKTYMDEADQFYADPEGFLRRIKVLPQRLVFFGSLTPKLELFRQRYLECARFFNTRFHDDWRRRGDVVVWCLREN